MAIGAGSPHTCKGKRHLRKGFSSSEAMSEWQWASLRPQRVNLSASGEPEFKQSLEGNLEYLWSSDHDQSSSHFATLLGGKAGEDSPKPRIRVSQGNYFGSQTETFTTSTSTSSPSWRTAGSQELAALVAQQAVANCDLPPPSRESVIKSSLTNSEAEVVDVFGEALCRSQTRAREAESLALRACNEKDELRQLLFREASMSLAYKHWLGLLQAENMLLLRMCKWSSSCLKHQLYSHKRRIIHRSSKNRHLSCWDALLRCTVAFAVGLGLASAGVMLGWSMGWILFAL